LRPADRIRSLGVELVAPCREAFFAFTGERVRGESDNGDVASLRTRTVKTEPLPSSLATVTSPPIMRACLRVMAKPRPVPPYCRNKMRRNLASFRCGQGPPPDVAAVMLVAPAQRSQPAPALLCRHHEAQAPTSNQATRALDFTIQGVSIVFRDRPSAFQMVSKRSCALSLMR
jgi:hypothetical protein